MYTRFILLFLLLFPTWAFSQEGGSDYKVGASGGWGYEVFDFSKMNSILKESGSSPLKPFVPTRSLAVYFANQKYFFQVLTESGNLELSKNNTKISFNSSNYCLAMGRDFHSKKFLSFAPYFGLNMLNYEFDLNGLQNVQNSFTSLFHDSSLSVHARSMNNYSLGLGCFVSAELSQMKLFRPLRYRFFANFGFRQGIYMNKWESNHGQKVADFPMHLSESGYLNVGIMLL